MLFCYGEKAYRGKRGAYYVMEGRYRRYVTAFDVRERYYTPFTTLPEDIDRIIWEYSKQLNCLHSNWGSFVYHLTYSQLRTLRNGFQQYVRPSNYLVHVFDHYNPDSRIYKKALRQLTNY